MGTPEKLLLGPIPSKSPMSGTIKEKLTVLNQTFKSVYVELEALKAVIGRGDYGMSKNYSFLGKHSATKLSEQFEDLWIELRKNQFVGKEEE